MLFKLSHFHGFQAVYFLPFPTFQQFSVGAIFIQRYELWSLNYFLFSFDLEFVRFVLFHLLIHSVDVGLAESEELFTAYVCLWHLRNFLLTIY